MIKGQKKVENAAYKHYKYFSYFNFRKTSDGENYIEFEAINSDWKNRFIGMILCEFPSASIYHHSLNDRAANMYLNDLK